VNSEVRILTLYAATVPEVSKNACRSSSSSWMNARSRRKKDESAKDS
jgi:hypothetical protein